MTYIMMMSSLMIIITFLMR